METEVVNMVDYLPISAERMRVICTATQEDTKLQMLITIIKKGWPENKRGACGNFTLLLSKMNSVAKMDWCSEVRELWFQIQSNMTPYSISTLHTWA